MIGIKKSMYIKQSKMASYDFKTTLMSYIEELKMEGRADLTHSIQSMKMLCDKALKHNDKYFPPYEYWEQIFMEEELVSSLGTSIV